MAKWAAFPYDNTDYRYSRTTLKKAWKRLHTGDAEPWPQQAELAEAWRLFHAGEFRQARDAGLALGGAGLTVANKAQCIHANYLERSEKAKLALFLEVAERAEAQQAEQPDNANAWYWQAYALGRYSQSISVAKALAQGMAPRIQRALQTTLQLQPLHADAHVALGSYHAELIHQVGPLLGSAQGADAATGLGLFERAMQLNPDSAITKVEFANGLVMLDGDRQMRRAEQLYADAAACTPLDAMERLDVEMARAELADE